MIHLIGSYYMTAGKSAYTVVEVEESRTKRVFKPGARYYPTLARAVAETAETALRDKIAAGEVATLHDAVEAFRCMKDEILHALATRRRIDHVQTIQKTALAYG